MRVSGRVHSIRYFLRRDFCCRCSTASLRVIETRSSRTCRNGKNPRYLVISSLRTSCSYGQSTLDLRGDFCVHAKRGPFHSVGGTSQRNQAAQEVSEPVFLFRDVDRDGRTYGLGLQQYGRCPPVACQSATTRAALVSQRD